MNRSWRRKLFREHPELKEFIQGETKKAFRSFQVSCINKWIEKDNDEDLNDGEKDYGEYFNDDKEEFD